MCHRGQYQFILVSVSSTKYVLLSYFLIVEIMIYATQKHLLVGEEVLSQGIKYEIFAPYFLKTSSIFLHRGSLSDLTITTWASRRFSSTLFIFICCIRVYQKIFILVSIMHEPRLLYDSFDCLRGADIDEWYDSWTILCETWIECYCLSSCYDCFSCTYLIRYHHSNDIFFGSEFSYSCSCVELFWEERIATDTTSEKSDFPVFFFGLSCDTSFPLYLDILQRVSISFRIVWSVVVLVELYPVTNFDLPR